MYRNTSRKKLKRQTKIRTSRIYRTGSAIVSNYKFFFLFTLPSRNHFRQKLLKTHLFESQILLDVSARSLCVTLKRKNCFTKFMQNENFGSQKKTMPKTDFEVFFLYWTCLFFLYWKLLSSKVLDFPTDLGNTFVFEYAKEEKVLSSLMALILANFVLLLSKQSSQNL